MHKTSSVENETENDSDTVLYICRYFWMENTNTACAHKIIKISILKVTYDSAVYVIVLPV